MPAAAELAQLTALLAGGALAASGAAAYLAVRKRHAELLRREGELTARRLQLEREAAERLEELHRTFVANVSHEFRTPLAAIKGYAESLRDGGLEQPRVALQFVRTIERNVERLSTLVESLLDVSAVESGRAMPRGEPLHLSSFVWSLVKGLERKAARRRLSVRVSVPAELSVVCDPAHLSQALRCLWDNAVQYNREGGRVELCAEASDGEVVIAVRDTGVGILPEDLPRVFDRFAQRRRARPRLGGSGLGLSVARSLVEANGGRLRVESTGPEGTILHLRLPAAHAAVK